MGWVEGLVRHLAQASEGCFLGLLVVATVAEASEGCFLGLLVVASMV